MFDLDEAVAVLTRTPAILDSWLGGLEAVWTDVSEGQDTFSPFDVVGHLIQGEIHDWIPRVRHILDGNADVPFQPFDRFAMREASRGRTIDDLLVEFGNRRDGNLKELRKLDLLLEDFCRPGLHPELGPVTLGELLAVWVVHDLNHVGQVARVMARRYENEVGPWVPYLPILG
jgi:hypothetical protein